MPRNYKKKTVGPSYSLEDLARAVSDVENKNKTFRQAEEFYSIPKAVIYHRIKGRKVSVHKMGAGRAPCLPPEVEIELENCIKAKSRMGCPCTKDDVKNIVAEYVKAHNLKTPFTNGIPGNDWYYGFMKRHPTLSFKKPEHLQKSRFDARKPAIIFNFYEDLEEVLNKYEITYPEKSCFVFNCDETGFCTDPRRLKAIGEKGVPLSRVSGGSGRESISVLATVSADGQCLPPLIIFKGVAVQARWTTGNAYPGTLYTTSSNGWMEEQIFNEWLTKSFIPHVMQLRLTRNMPDQAAILVYDGHKTHISYRIIKASLDNNIQLVKLPAHLSDKLQPLDKCVFKPVKDDWEKRLVNFAKKQVEKRESGRLSKCQFAEMLGEVWKSSMKPENIVKGFLSTGIFPCNSTKFPESLFDPIELAQYKNKKQGIGKVADNAVINESPSTSNIHASVTPDVLPSAHSPQSIIGIFTSKLHSNTQPSIVKRKEVIPRLKPLRYGEILTSEEVLMKQKEAEELRANKNKGKSGKRTIKDKKSQKKGVSGDADKYGLLVRGESAENATPQKTSDKGTTLRKIRNKRKKTSNEIVDDDEEDYAMETELCEDDSDDDLENYSETMRIEAIPEIIYETPVWSNISVGKFLLVDFKGGRRNQTHYTYVCRVLEVDDDDGEIVVQGYIKRNSLATEFSIIPNDISAISLEMVVAILPEPESKQENEETFSVFAGRVAVHEK